MVLGDYAEALGWATRSLARQPDLRPHLWMLIAANAHLGRMDEARRYLAELRRLAPEVTVASIRAGQPRQGPRPDRADPRRAAAGRAAGGIAVAACAARIFGRFGSFTGR